jgi:hypothetical protein
MAMSVDPSEDELARNWNLTPADLAMIAACRGADQRRRFAHPEGTDVPALHHLLGGRETIAADRDYSSRRRGGCIRRSVASRPSFSTKGGYRHDPALSSRI